MKKIVSVLFMAVLLAAMSLSVSAATKQVVTTGDVNLRKGPGLDYAVVTSVSKGTKLSYTGTSKSDKRGVNWFKVTYKNKTSWVSSRYSKLTTVTSTARKVKANTDVNLRKGPGLNYGVATSVSKGTTLTYLNKTTADSRGVNWFKVSYKGNAYWISSRYSQFV